MMQALIHFPPTQAEAIRRLDAFVPKSGTLYAQRRNFDHGQGGHNDVSILSPYLRARLLDEGQVTRAVLGTHTAAEADKFLTEVFWRTYWKGWMELRPRVWEAYLNDLRGLGDDVQTQSGLRNQWEAACLGDTGIAPFDAWAHELVETGYLHNHARMWFASIWIFTLGLPWQLGADFFLRHLLDGDVAVNTLSWRWVAGIQTRGKTYLATAENIAKFTGGRYLNVPDLAEVAPAVAAPEAPPSRPLLPCTPLPLPERYGIVTHGDDVDMQRLLKLAPAPASIAYLEAPNEHGPWQMAPHVTAFRQAAALSSARSESLDTFTSAQDLANWAGSNRLAQIVTPYAPTGPIADVLRSYQKIEGTAPLSVYRRSLDSEAWPLATKGFFPFRKNIPKLIAHVTRPVD